MVQFEINKRFDFLYLPGMEIQFMDSNLRDCRIGVVTSVDLTSVKISTGELVDKGLVFGLVNQKPMGVFA